MPKCAQKIAKRLEGSFSTTITWTKKIGEGPQFVKNRTQKWLFFAKRCQIKGPLLDNQNMKKKIWGGTTIYKKIIPENAYFSQYERWKRVNLMGNGGEGGKKLLDHHNMNPNKIGEAPQFVKKSYPKMAIFQPEH